MKETRIQTLLTVSFLICVAALTASAYRNSPPSKEEPTVIAAAAPLYPPIAIAARALGNVVVEVKIDSDGNVSAAKAVSGHPLLQQAAKVAALRWKFENAAAKSDTRTAKLTFVFRITDKKLPAAEATPLLMPPYKVEITFNPPEIVNSKSF